MTNRASREREELAKILDDVIAHPHREARRKMWNALPRIATALRTPHGLPGGVDESNTDPDSPTGYVKGSEFPRLSIRPDGKLQWQDGGKHQIFHTEGRLFAPIAVLEHTVGAANFEVYRDTAHWCAYFWHGNMGHFLGNSATQAGAKALAEKHCAKLLSAFTAALAYKAKRDGESHAAMAELAKQAQELDMGYK